MGESCGSASGSVSVDVERISFGGKVREEEPCAYLASFLFFEIKAVVLLKVLVFLFAG
jgi:hypothetical protein